VGDVLGTEDERTGARLNGLLADAEGHLAFEDVEGLVLFAVQVEWRPGSRGLEDLDDRVEVARLFARGLDGHQRSETTHTLSRGSALG
jgi:hypothetical protein